MTPKVVLLLRIRTVMANAPTTTPVLQRQRTPVSGAAPSLSGPHLYAVTAVVLGGRR